MRARGGEITLDEVCEGLGSNSGVSRSRVVACALRLVRRGWLCALDDEPWAVTKDGLRELGRPGAGFGVGVPDVGVAGEVSRRGPKPSLEKCETALAGIAAGLRDCEIRRATGLSRDLIRKYRHGAAPPLPRPEPVSTPEPVSPPKNHRTRESAADRAQRIDLTLRRLTHAAQVHAQPDAALVAPTKEEEVQGTEQPAPQPPVVKTQPADRLQQLETKLAVVTRILSSQNLTHQDDRIRFALEILTTPLDPKEDRPS